MNPGLLDRRITIQVRTMGRDDAGARVESWTDEATVWARLEKQVADESTIADTERPRTKTTWRIRYRIIDSVSHRVTYKDKTYEIVGITETGGRNNFLTLETYALEVTT